MLSTDTEPHSQVEIDKKDKEHKEREELDRIRTEVRVRATV